MGALGLTLFQFKSDPHILQFTCGTPKQVNKSLFITIITTGIKRDQEHHQLWSFATLQGQIATEKPLQCLAVIRFQYLQSVWPPLSLGINCDEIYLSAICKNYYILNIQHSCKNWIMPSLVKICIMEGGCSSSLGRRGALPSVIPPPDVPRGTCYAS